MRQLGHLQEYTITLTTKGPVFIGSGEKYLKHDYIFDEIRKTVSFIDQTKFFQLLIDRNLIDKYESFILGKRSESSVTIHYFLKNICKLDSKTIQSLISHRVSAADALDENHSLKEIQAFIRRADGRAYIPGSSLKGCLRTILLVDKVLCDPNKKNHRIPSLKGKGDNRKLENWSSQLESNYLHTLHMTDKPNNMVNSIMRGISIADSEPICEDSMILASKIDSFPDGSKNTVPIVRQCIAPETKITFQLTLDQNILSNPNIMTELRESIRSFDAFYTQEYNSYFSIKKEFEYLFEDDFILLGGGSGFFGKNLVYPFYAPNHEQAVKTVSQMLPTKHKHGKDIEYGISPRAFKITQFKRFAYPMGLCQVTIQ